MEELDLKELFTIFWAKKTQIVIITLIFVILGMLYTTFLVKPKYKASTKIVLTQQASAEEKTTESSITVNDINLNSKLVSTYRDIVKSNTVVRKVLTNLGMELDEEEAVKKSISVTAGDDTEIIEITVTNAEPERAAIIANELVNVFTDRVKEVFNITNVSVIDKAEPDEIPYNINHVKDVLIFAIIGIVVSIGYVLISYMLDTSVKDAEDVEKVVNVPVLASIPIYDEEEAAKGGSRK